MIRRHDALRGLLVAACLAGCVGLLPVRERPRPEALVLPPGFTISVFARGLGPARTLALDPAGTLLVSVPREGRVLALPDDDRDGQADRIVTVADGLDLPHGLAFHRGALHVAETGRVVRLRYDAARRQAAGPAEVVVPGLPSRGAHWTRTIAFGPDGRLYVAVGSSCNVCEERDPRRAAITRYEAEGGGETRVATGLRNAVGLAFHPERGDLWATDNGRDWLGDDLPPDLVTRVESSAAYGWPHCYWTEAGAVLDPALGLSARCRGLARPTVLLEAHVTPLGLVFYTGRQFPPEYHGSLFVALHGSWNRTSPVGYRVVRLRFEGDSPRAVDFASGWLAGGRAWGRPADVLVGADGSLFVSDDLQGLVYRIAYRGG